MMPSPSLPMPRMYSWPPPAATGDRGVMASLGSATTSVTASTTIPIRPGPISLGEPLALDAALRDAATIEIQAGKAWITQAQEAEPTDPVAAEAAYARAQLSLARANALLLGIARSFHVQIARLRIGAIRRSVEAEVRNYDENYQKLGTLAPGAYRPLLQTMIHHLDGGLESLGDILRIAKPYPKELVMEVLFAKTDLKKLRAQRSILRDALNGK